MRAVSVPPNRAIAVPAQQAEAILRPMLSSQPTIKFSTSFVRLLAFGSTDRVIKSKELLAPFPAASTFRCVGYQKFISYLSVPALPPKSNPRPSLVALAVSVLSSFPGGVIFQVVATLLVSIPAAFFFLRELPELVVTKPATHGRIFPLIDPLFATVYTSNGVAHAETI